MGGKWKTRFSEKAGDERNSVLLWSGIPEFQFVSAFFCYEKYYRCPDPVQKRDKEEVYEEAKKLLAKMGLADKADAYPYQLSGGSSSVYRSHGHWQ